LNVFFIIAAARGKFPSLSQFASDSSIRPCIPLESDTNPIEEDSAALLVNVFEISNKDLKVIKVL